MHFDLIHFYLISSLLIYTITYIPFCCVHGIKGNTEILYLSHSDIPMVKTLQRKEKSV